MKGLVDYLTGATPAACALRDRFVFKIVPMLNPDGVVIGNYRCHLAGLDLNRTWSDPSRTVTPTIFSLKRMLASVKDDREVVRGVHAAPAAAAVPAAPIMPAPCPHNSNHYHYHTSY